MVETWPETTVLPHRFGGIVFRLCARELGHLNGDTLLDVPFPLTVCNELIAAGGVKRYHLLPRNGWVSLRLREESYIHRAMPLLRRSYDIARELHHRRDTPVA